MQPWQEVLHQTGGDEPRVEQDAAQGTQARGTQLARKATGQVSKSRSRRGRCCASAQDGFPGTPEGSQQAFPWAQPCRSWPDASLGLLPAQETHPLRVSQGVFQASPHCPIHEQPHLFLRHAFA